MTDWATLKVVDLKAELTNRGLSTKGLKADLVSRLTDDDEVAAPVEAAQEHESTDDTAPPSANDAPTESSPKPTAITEASEPAVATTSEDLTKQSEVASVAPIEAELSAPSQDPASTTNRIVDTAQNDQPPIETPLPTNDDLVDEQKRKRRSITPQPSTKRARHEEERSAEDHESAVYLEANNDAFSSPKKPQYSAENDQASTEDVNMIDESLELSGEAAYAKRVAIAESSNLREFSAPQAQRLSRAESEDRASATRDARARSPERAPVSLGQYQSPSLDESGEAAYAKRVAIAESSKQYSTSLPQRVAVDRSPVTRSRSRSRSRSPQPKQEPHEYAQGDVPQESQASGHPEQDDSSLPSSHPPTSALYIRELMRPLKSETMENYIVELISSSGIDRDTDPIRDFYLDQIRTHAFVSLPSISAAQIVRAALHNQVWPDERNRKALWVDFIPEENVKGWIEQEEDAPRGARWEVVYEQGHNGTVAIHREAGLDQKPFSRPPPTGPAAAGPVYPGVEGAPRGPRGRGPPGGSERSTFQNPSNRQTETHPQLSYVPKDEDVARRRITNMRSFYARDPAADLGKDYHRFTFESADSFVDRGVEVFIGIRPPHRQKEHEERLRREGPGATGAGRLVESRRDDYRPAPRPSVKDEDRFSRHGDGRRSERFDWPPRNRGFRNDRGSGRFRGEDPYRYRPGY